MTILLTTGLYHVVANDGPLPYWVEARTVNRKPVMGTERRVRGFDTEERAVRYMRRATKEALAAEPSLKRYLTSRDGAPLPEASGSPHASGGEVGADSTPKRRGRPPGSRNRNNRIKPGPKPKAKPAGRAKLIPFSSTRFEVRSSLSNPLAQVWVCTDDDAKLRGRAAQTGVRKSEDLPHKAGSFAVTRLIDGKLYVTVDEDGDPLIYPNYTAAERDAIFYYTETPEPKPAINSRVHYKVGGIEVHILPLADGKRPYRVFDTKYDDYLEGAGGNYLTYARLDKAIDAANAHYERTLTPPSLRFIASITETADEKFEREQREAHEEAVYRRRSEMRYQQWEEDERERQEQARRKAERDAEKGRRPATPEEIAAKKASRQIIRNPTPEQKLQAARAKRSRQAYSARLQQSEGESE